MTRMLLIASALLAVALATSGCCCCVPCGMAPDYWNWSGWPAGEPAPVGELRQEHRSVPIDAEATSARVQILFGGGEFRLEPGATGLLDGEFTYNVHDWAPRLESRTQGGVQIVTLRPQNEIRWGGWDAQDVRNEWEVKLNREAPLDLELSLGAFQGSMDLGGLRLRGLTLNAGACDGDVAFSAPNPETIDDLEVMAGAARLSLTGLGNAGFRSMTFRGGAGDFELSFDGAFKGQSTVYVESGMSKVVIRVPREVGVRVELEGGLSSTRLTGFSQSGNVFTNSSYGQASDQLIISVKMGMGELVLESK